MLDGRDGGLWYCSWETDSIALFSGMELLSWAGRNEGDGIGATFAECPSVGLD